VPQTLPDLKIELNQQKAENEKQQSAINDIEKKHEKEMEDIKQQFAVLRNIVERANRLEDSPKNIKGRE
jgi:hypothetical protein